MTSPTRPGIEIVGEAADGADALPQIAALTPDVVFLDIQMPGLSGLDVAARLEPPRPRVIFCTAFDQFAIDAFEHHAVDYLLKPINRERLMRTVARISGEVDEQRRQLREDALRIKRAAGSRTDAGAADADVRDGARGARLRGGVPAGAGHRRRLLRLSEARREVRGADARRRVREGHLCRPPRRRPAGAPAGARVARRSRPRRNPARAECADGRHDGRPSLRHGRVRGLQPHARTRSPTPVPVIRRP